MAGGGLVIGGSGGLKSVGESPGTFNPPTYYRYIYQWLSPAPAVNSTNTLSFWYWATNSATNLFIRIRNSSSLTTGSQGTNINIFFTPSNYVAPVLITAATNALTPGAANQPTTNLPLFQPPWINELQADNTTGRTAVYGDHNP